MPPLGIVSHCLGTLAMNVRQHFNSIGLVLAALFLNLARYIGSWPTSGWRCYGEIVEHFAERIIRRPRNFTSAQRIKGADQA